MQHYRRTIRIVQPATSRGVGGDHRSLYLFPEFVFSFYLVAGARAHRWHNNS